jgi:hypothetical protein
VANQLAGKEIHVITDNLSVHKNKQPKPVKWKYFDPSRRISSASTVTVHLHFPRLQNCSPTIK